MLQIVLVAIGAGAASALLFASVASGAVPALLLFYLAPLPIMIAALGWSHFAGLAGALIAAGVLGAGFGLYFFLAFLFGVGLPAWWLGYLALLGRTVVVNGSGAALEWYPVGRLVTWAALLAAAVVAASVFSFGADKDSYQSALRNLFERALGSQPQTIPLGADPKLVNDILVIALPPAAAVLMTILNVCNLWLAARAVKVSGRLQRPWPDLSAMSLAPLAPPLLAAAMLGAFLPDLVGVIAGVFAAALLMAYAMMGLAVIHAVTRNTAGRPFALGATYLFVFVFGWPILALSMLGLAESAFHIRDRFAAAGPPRSPT